MLCILAVMAIHTTIDYSILYCSLALCTVMCQLIQAVLFVLINNKYGICEEQRSYLKSFPVHIFFVKQKLCKYSAYLMWSIGT